MILKICLLALLNEFVLLDLLEVAYEFVDLVIQGHDHQFLEQLPAQQPASDVLPLPRDALPRQQLDPFDLPPQGRDVVEIIRLVVPE